jgi:hypothetical protein
MRTCKKCRKVKPVSQYTNQRSLFGRQTKTCKCCRDRNINSERKRRHSVQIRNNRVEVASTRLTAKPETRWCPGCKREAPIAEYVSPNSRKPGLMKSCLWCRELQARSRRRRKGEIVPTVSFCLPSATAYRPFLSFGSFFRPALVRHWTSSSPCYFRTILLWDKIIAHDQML